MSPSHIITAIPSSFDLRVNELIAARDTALSLRSVTFANGQLTAVLDELPRAKQVSGSMLELRMRHTQAALPLVVADMEDNNPYLRVEAAFYVPIVFIPDAKAARARKSVPLEAVPDQPAVLIIAAVYQP